MTDREMKNISTVLRNYIYMYVNENYKDNLDVMKFTLEINEEHMDAWVKDILLHDILWRNTERLLEQEQTGHWIDQIDNEEKCKTLICSNCGRPAFNDENSIWASKFCPHCGARMSGVSKK